MKYIIIAIATLSLCGCHQSQWSILDAPGHGHATTAPSKAPTDPDTTDCCPICGKPDHTNNGHHYGQHKHQPPKGNG